LYLLFIPQFFYFASLFFFCKFFLLHLGSLDDPSTVSQLCYRDSVSPQSVPIVGRYPVLLHKVKVALYGNLVRHISWEDKIWALHYLYEKLLNLLKKNLFGFVSCIIHPLWLWINLSSNSILTCSSKLSIIKRTSTCCSQPGNK
jgi:hypothetical protein